MDKILIKCDKCGKEYKTRFWNSGDIHKDCKGEFKKVIK